MILIWFISLTKFSFSIPSLISSLRNSSFCEQVATAQDDITGDGTTSNVLIIGELLKQADIYIQEGLHPRLVTEGFEMAKKRALEVGFYVPWLPNCHNFD